jgi:CRP/FNR family transcriptional regulator
VCGALTPEQLSTLAKSTTKHSYGPSEPIVADGEKVERYANILSGVAKLAKLTADGRQQIVGLQFAPDFLGRIFNKTSDFDVEAATEMRVCSFPRETLENIVRQNPELEHRLHAQTLKELDEARDWMLTLGRKSAAERVASFLHYIATHSNPEPGAANAQRVIVLPLKRSDMADFLGLTIETVSRQLTKLKQAKIIDLPDSRSVALLDPRRLIAAMEQNSDRN